MNKALGILFGLMFGLPVILLAQFEGAIDMKVIMNDEGKSHEMMYTMLVKKNMVATNIKDNQENGEKGKIILRGDKKVLWVVNENEKSFLEISFKDENKENKPSSKADIEKPKIKKTGKKQTILGYVCDEIIVEDEGSVSHIWGTSKLGNLYEDLMKSFGEIGGAEAKSKSKAWEDELALMKIFPLKIETTKDGKPEQTQEVTKIESKSIAASTFEVPKDYKKQSLNFDTQKMMKEMQEQMKKQKEMDKDNPGQNVDMEKLMKQMQEMQKAKDDTSGRDN